MGLVKVGKITLKEAAEKIGVSYQQAKRIKRKVKEKGVQGLIHGNTGRSPQNRLRTNWRAGRDRGGSRETVRKIWREAGIGPKRKRRAKRHRKRRERMVQEHPQYQKNYEETVKRDSAPYEFALMFGSRWKSRG